MAPSSSSRRIGQAFLAAAPSFMRSAFQASRRDPGLVVASIRAHSVQQLARSCSHKSVQRPLLSRSPPFRHVSSRFISDPTTRHNHWRLQSLHSATRIVRPTIHCQDLSSATPAVVPVRSLNIFTVFRKESRDKEIERLKDELNRGYFDDFKELKETGGKLGPSPTSSPLPAAGAALFPRITGTTSSRASVELPLDLQGDTCPVVLVCVAFRANAQGMVESWLKPFLQHASSSSSSAAPSLSTPSHTPAPASTTPDSSQPTDSLPHRFPPGSVRAVHISWIESWLLSTRPIRSWLLSSLRGAEAKQQARLADAVGSEGVDGVLTNVYAFGDAWEFRKRLGIVNRLTGYAFLVDGKGRVRWRASGTASDDEVTCLLSATDKLLKE
ncbi:unnamed protein product [Closterium sp. Yama58-4]|nr:unnamed protein product [Closterium sp. Yama58-4]